MNTRRWIALAVGVVSSALFVALAFRNLDVSQLRTALQSAEPWPWVPLAVSSYVLGHVLRGVRCKALVSRDAHLSVPRATSVVVLGYAANNVLPARLGELVRSGLLSKESGVPLLQAISLTVLERILDGLALLLLLVVVALRLPSMPFVDAAFSLAATVFGIASLGVLLAVVAPRALLSLASRTAQRLGTKVHDRLVGALTELVSGVAYLRSASAAAGMMALSVLIWLFEGGMFLALLPAFGLPADPFWALLALCITNLGILVPSSPGFIGTFHFFCMSSLVALGVSQGLALSYATAVHLSFFVPVTLWGVAIAASYGVSLTSMATQAARAVPWSAERGRKPVARMRPARHAEEAPSAHLVWLCTALVPLEEIAEEQRQRVVQDVAQFVQLGTRALPGHLSWLMAAGLHGFRVLTWLRFLRSTRRVSPERYRQWVELFAYGRLAAPRQLFRALRSLALIAFYEHGVTAAQRRPKASLHVVRNEGMAAGDS